MASLKGFNPYFNSLVSGRLEGMDNDVIFHLRVLLLQNECHRRRTGINRLTYMRLKRRLSEDFGEDQFDSVKPQVQEEVEKAQAHMKYDPQNRGAISEEKEQRIIDQLSILRTGVAVSAIAAGGKPMVIAASHPGEDDLLVGSGKLFRFKMFQAGNGLSEGNRFIKDDNL